LSLRLTSKTKWPNMRITRSATSKDRCWWIIASRLCKHVNAIFKLRALSSPST
jgi:hypothetical protein